MVDTQVEVVNFNYVGLTFVLVYVKSCEYEIIMFDQNPYASSLKIKNKTAYACSYKILVNGYMLFVDLFHKNFVCFCRPCNDQIYHCIERNWNVQGSSSISGNKCDWFWRYIILFITWMCVSFAFLLDSGKLFS